MPKFDDATIEQLFGADDAENEQPERFKQYFYYNNAYSSLTSDLPIRIIVGHKGVGKSALLKRAFISDQDNNNPSIWLRPEALTNVEATTSPSDQFIQRIENWKRGILLQIINAFYDELAIQRAPELQDARIRDLIDVILHIADKASPSAKGTTPVNIYVDDIDRGWSASATDIKNISALLNAVRDIGGLQRRLRFRIGLRTDVYYLVRTSDESTDKIERNVIWLKWSNNEVLRLAAKRIATFFDMKFTQEQIERMQQGQISQSILSRVISSEFKGKGHWDSRPIHNVLLSLTRARPRDLIKLFHLSAKRANVQGTDIISSTQLESIFEPYSQERLQDIINEFKSELPSIERLLLSMKPTKKERRTSENYLFTTASLSSKLHNIIHQNTFKFTNGRDITPKSLIQFLYKIDFITARKELSDGTIDRKYFDEGRFLASEFNDFGYNWEVHPAYRWALQPQDVQSLIDELFK